MDNNLKILDLPLSERPLEKLLSLGAESLNNSELLAIILRCGVKGENVLSLSQRILCELQGLDGIMNASYDEITSITGIKKVKASQILAVAELFKRFNTLKSNRIEIGINQEVLKLVVLNTKNKIIRVKDVFKGSLNTSIVHPREIYSEAIRCGGASIIICHNHPSGDATPSKEDINITARIKECGKIIGIELLDHIIIGNNEYTSLKEKGII